MTPSFCSNAISNNANRTFELKHVAVMAEVMYDLWHYFSPKTWQTLAMPASRVRTFSTERRPSTYYSAVAATNLMTLD